MLTTCPECQLPVSDKAITCPHCGYPLKPDSTKTIKKHSCTSTRRKKRLPNGFGQITKISKKNLRNPYRAMVTVAKTDEGRPVQKLLKPRAYFPTYNDAYSALLEYNRNPYNLLIDPTVEDVYKLWREDFLKKPKAAHTVCNYDAPWHYCSSVYSLPIRQLKPAHIKRCIDPGDDAPEVPRSIKRTIKILFNVLLDYAVENEYADRNCARSFKLPEEISMEISEKRREHSSFTDDEMKLLWKNKKDEDVQTILIQCYTGLRPGELCSVLISNIDFEKNIIVAGMKTKAGKGRTIPMHPDILPFVKAKYQTSQEFGIDKLITTLYKNKGNRVPMTYASYNYRFDQTLKMCGIVSEHRPHDPRKQFVTMAKKYKLEDYAIKRIVGHAIDDITEAIYTDRSTDWLKEEIYKIPCKMYE